MNIDLTKFKNLWVEKYRPTNLNEIMLTDSVKDVVKSFLDKKEIPHLLFSGPAGIGKTSLAKIIVSALECDYIYLNASDQNGIDAVRGKITDFCSTAPMGGSIKVCILDEFDGFSTEGMRCLRGVMEEYAETTRFILTCNEPGKIIEPIISRLQIINLEVSPILFLKRIASIAVFEKIKIENPDEFKAFVRAYYPDFRKCLNELNLRSVKGDFSFKNETKVLQKIIEHKKDVRGLRQIFWDKIQKNEISAQKVLSLLFNEIFESREYDSDKKTKLMLVVSEYIYKGNLCADKEINMFSCFLTVKDEL